MVFQVALGPGGLELHGRGESGCLTVRSLTILRAHSHLLKHTPAGPGRRVTLGLCCLIVLITAKKCLSSTPLHCLDTFRLSVIMITTCDDQGDGPPGPQRPRPDHASDT